MNNRCAGIAARASCSVKAVLSSMATAGNTRHQGTPAALWRVATSASRKPMITLGIPSTSRPKRVSREKVAAAGTQIAVGNSRPTRKSRAKLAPTRSRDNRRNHPTWPAKSDRIRGRVTLTEHPVQAGVGKAGFALASPRFYRATPNAAARSSRTSVPATPSWFPPVKVPVSIPESPPVPCKV